MNLKQSKTMCLLPFILLVVFGSSGCAGRVGISGQTMSWKEEVQLHDGRVAIADRFYTLGGYPTLDSKERTAVHQTVSFTLPDANKPVTWQTDFRDSMPEPNSLNLLLFDIVGGVPYIATYPAGCIAYNKWQRPNPPYILFKHEQGEWKRIAMADFPAKLSRTNMIVGRPPVDLLKSYYTTEEVKAKNYHLEPKYQAVLRETIATPDGRCGEMVRTKNGGWLGTGWFKDQPTREACLDFCRRKEVNAEYCPCEHLFKDREQ